jgi:hypothetical protein
MTDRLQSAAEERISFVAVARKRQIGVVRLSLSDTYDEEQTKKPFPRGKDC